MSISKTTSKIAGVLGAAALVVSLAACSGGQSVAEACMVAEKTVSEAQGDMQTAVTDAMSGEGDFNELFSSITDGLVKAEKEVQNAEVSDALKAITTDFSKVEDIFKDFKMPNTADLDYTDPEAMAELEEISAELQSKTGELEELSASLEESSTKLQELCNI